MTVPTIAGLSASELAAVRTLNAELERRRSHNQLRDGLYEGKHAAQLLGLAGATRYQRTAAVIGWPAKTVDLMGNRIVLAGVDQVGGDDLGVSQVLRDNDFRAEIAGAITSHLLHGVAFLVSSRGGPGEPAGMLHVVDGNSGTGTWNPRTRRLDSFLSVHSQDDHATLTAFTLYLPGETVTAQKGKAGKWAVARDKKHSGVPVEVLRYRYRPGSRPFGRSRITRPVIGLTEAAMRVAMRMEGHADLYSIPQLMLLGASADDLTTADGKSAWVNKLGAVLGLSDNDEGAVPRAAVHQISASSPEPHLEQLRQYAQLLSGETSIPVSSLGVSDLSNPTSADSYIASREDLIGEAESAADSLSGPVARAVARTTAYAHGLSDVPAGWDLQTRWRNAAHVSLAARADAGAKQLGALPWLAETPLGPELAGLTEAQSTRALQYQQRAAAASLIDRLVEGPVDEVSATAEEDRPAEAQGVVDAAEMKAKFDALGIAIRAGVQPEDAAARLGLAGVKFTGGVPVSIRMPESKAEGLEDR